MDRHHHSNAYNSIGNTNRRFKTNYHPSNYQPSTTYSINFSVPASQNVITRPYLPGQTRKDSEPSAQSSYSSSLNKYKLLEKELDKRKKQQQQLPASQKHHQSKQPGHSQSYSNIFSNKSPQFANRDHCPLAKPTSLRSNASTSTSCDTTNSLNDLYKVENLFNLDLDRKKEPTGKNDAKSKSIEFVRTIECNKAKGSAELSNGQALDRRRSSSQKISEKLNDKLNRRSNEKLDNKPAHRSNSASPSESSDKLNHHHHHHHHHQARTKLVDKKADEIVSKQSTTTNNQNNPDSSPEIHVQDHRPTPPPRGHSAGGHHPKIVLTQPSIDLANSRAIEEESYLTRNQLNVRAAAKQDVDSAAKDETKSNCWFSWFKVFLTGFGDSEGSSRTRSFRGMTWVLVKKWYRELFLASILLICIFNAIRTNNLATRKARLPEKFFPSNSLIHDYEFGDITELSQLAFQHEVTVVMYYSPWSSDCLAFREEYLRISQYYKEQIFFAAVNCWWSEGECSKSYRIKKYPVFISHIRNIGEVEYKGPLVTSYLIPFLENLLNPVKPILNEGDLLDLKARHDAVIVGYFDFNENPNPNGYKHFLLASIKALHQDPFRQVQFAIVSSKKAALKLNIEQSQSVNLYSWNSTHKYRNKLRKIDNFLKWIFNTLDEIGPLVEWITPQALKSDTLSVKLLAEPTLILFTPRSLILNISPYYDILREVAMDYFNCDANPQIKSLIHRIILRRRLKEEKLFELEEKCHEIARSKANLKEYKSLPKDFSRDDRCCHSSVLSWRPIGKAFDKQCYCTACVNINKKICPSGCKKFNCLATASRYLTSFEPNVNPAHQSFNSTVNYCNELKSTYYPKYTPFYDIKMTCSGIPNQDEDDVEYGEETSSLNAFRQPGGKQSEYADESMERMLKNFEEQHCKRLSLGLNYNDFNFPDSMESSGSSSTASQKWRQNFTGLGCRTNKTLGFIAIDSLMYQSFTESLGINAFNETHATVIMIVEAQEENIYVLNHRLSKKEDESSTINKRKIYEFIKDYSDSKLRRYLRSPLEKEISSSEQCVNKTDEAGRRVICVPEVTTLTFNEIVLDDSKDVLLLFYTPWCVFCSAIASTFLTVARFFTGIEGILFARLNADVNNLPFEYSVDRYPTLMLFPAKRKSESVTFPANMPITTSSLLQFVLANVQEKVKYQSSFQLCNRECLKRNFLAHHVESKELNLARLRLVNRMGSLKRELNSLLDNAKNKNLKSILNDYLLTYGRMMRGKENRLNLFNNLKEILSKRMLSFDDELAQDLNNQLLNDMINVLNAPTTPAQQATSSRESAKESAPKKPTKSRKSKTAGKPANKKDEL